MNLKHDQLMLKKVLGTITREEEQLLEAWINGSALARKRYDAFKASWEHRARNAPEFTLNRRPEARRTSPRPVTPPEARAPKTAGAPASRPQAAAPVVPRKNQHSRIAEGIAIALVCISSFFLFLGLKDYPRLYEAKGANSPVVLPDSSEVTIKAGGALKVSGHFQKDTRTVYLYGNAHFTTRNVPKPFVVKTGNAEYRGMAESFIVNAENTTGGSEILVLKGSMRVTPLGNDWRKVTISSGQKGMVDPGGKRVVVASFDTVNALAWKDRIITFNKTPLAEAIPTLEEYFNVKFEMRNEAIGDCRLSRTFREPNIMDVVETIRRNLGVRVSREPGVIILEGKGCPIRATRKKSKG